MHDDIGKDLRIYFSYTGMHTTATRGEIKWTLEYAREIPGSDHVLRWSL